MQILIKHATRTSNPAEDNLKQIHQMGFSKAPKSQMHTSKEGSASPGQLWPPSLAPNAPLYSEALAMGSVLQLSQQLLPNEVLGAFAAKLELGLHCFLYNRDKLSLRNKPGSVSCARKTCTQVIIMSLLRIKHINKIPCRGFSWLLVSFILINTWHCINTQTVFYSITFL